ncbi:MAG: cysteine desulfurase family protein [Deltaproteobacteria bacterium]|nr:cysteine desulfurase family protein [Deltaproteobacteria bacterium]
MTVICLDHNATTPPDPAVRDEMAACLDGALGNPSSIHSLGQEARRVIDKARAQVARLIGAQPEEIVFTSGGTEANNLAIFGSVAATKRPRSHVVTTAIEHRAVLGPCRHIEQAGGSVTFLAVDREGLLDPASAISSLRDETVIASIMLANNDVGTVQPVAALSAKTRERGILLHSDAVQAVGKLPVEVNTLGVDLMSFSGHKLHGPQGVGALYIRTGTMLSPLVFGGRQERGLRPGTENVAAIAGFGKACELAAGRLAEDAAHLNALRFSFEAALLDRVRGATINGRGAPRLSNTSNVCFDGLDGEALTINLDMLGLAVSTGAACGTADHEPSHVLTAMGRTIVEARSSVRFSFGRGNTQEDVHRAVDLVARAAEMMRKGRR